MAVDVANLAARLELMQGVKPDFSWRPIVPERRIMVASDVHIPYHHAEAVAKMLKDAADFNADAIVWLGDLLDNPTFSSWGNEDLHTTFDDELEQVEFLVRTAADIVPVQYWSLGNHEARWMRKVGYQGNMKRLAYEAGLKDLMDSGQLYVFDSPSLSYHDDEWMLTHPAQYGSTPLVVPGKLAERFGKHVVSAHAHHWGMGISESGRFTVIESGGLFDETKVKYVQHRVTTHRAWVRGYVFLEDGEPTLIRA